MTNKKQATAKATATARGLGGLHPTHRDEAAMDGAPGYVFGRGSKDNQK
jgi:hypothetical protein